MSVFANLDEAYALLDEGRRDLANSSRVDWKKRVDALLSKIEAAAWRDKLYEDGKTPDKKSVDEAADEFRRANLTTVSSKL